MQTLFRELRRRNVFRVAAVYAVTGWLIAQAAVVLEGALKLPDWFDSIIVVTLLLGFPVALILAWAFELTPEGFKPTGKADTSPATQSSKKRGLNMALGGALALAIAFIAFDTIILDRRAPNIVQEVEAREASIAVLPFEDFSPDKDQDYFANGISEELLNVLAKIDGLRVSSRTSAFAFKGQETPISEIGDALDVAHVLEGSIRTAGTTVRITAQLIETDTDVHLWSETYDRPLSVENVFDIQDEIAAAIVAELRGQLDLDIPERDATDIPTNIEAYQLYLRGRDVMWARTPDAIRAAIAHFETAIELDDSFVPAHAGLADAYLLLQSYGRMGTQEALDRAQPFIDKALRLDPESSDALSSAAFAANIQFDIEDSLAFSRRAIAANPTNTSAYLRLGNALGNSGNPSAAVDAYRKGLETDPLNPILLSNLASQLMTAGDIDEAVAIATRMVNLNPSSLNGHLSLAQAKEYQGDYPGAHASYKTGQSINPDNYNMALGLAYLYMNLGMEDEALAVSTIPRVRALILVWTGDTEGGLALLPDDASIVDRIYTTLFARDYQAFYESVQSIFTTLGWPDKDLELEELLTEYANTAFISRQLERPEAELFMAKLMAYFQDRSPEDHNDVDTISAATVYYSMIDDWDRTYAWLDRSADLGLIIRLEDFPSLDDQRGTPEYERVKARHAALQARNRQVVQVQLADPPDHWPVPDQND